ncbi:uncharacterized protein LOC131247108 [Magnolia sinica]|uniref:uncharacterized protein LOC131247108 n=1 Tax=Magnolia sinica TaxID=86752 RepID=UPI00265830FC|nr:uncharacterized protein LOC131247108 [Magnolia sinica]
MAVKKGLMHASEKDCASKREKRLRMRFLWPARALEVSLWWDSVLRTIAAGYMWTWEAFETRFHEKYFPLTYRHEKESEFLRLRQGGKSVAKYENRFTDLARYAPLILIDQPMRMRQFSEGLRPEIRSKMCCASISSYAELVGMFLRAEQDGDRLSCTRMLMVPRPRSDLPSRPFLCMRPHVDSSPRLAAPPAPVRRPDLWCTYCKRSGHVDTYCFTKMRNNGFSPPQRINHPLPQTIVAPPLRLAPAHPSFRLPAPRFRPPQ